MTLRIVVEREPCGYGWLASDENYAGPPEHVGYGITQHDAITDLLMWLDAEAELADVVVIDEL
jgi:hypothetical protein